LREIAAEDVVDSCTVAAAAVDFDARGHRVLHYEGPFGVGYLEAILHEPVPPTNSPTHGSDAQQPPHALLAVARDAIDRHMRGLPVVLPKLAAPWDRARGVFITLRTRDGQLRGCIGHLGPTRETLCEEVATCAVSAAIHDSRFDPVTAAELTDLRLEISILETPISIASVDELDPKRYGVIVSSQGRRGVLLPDIEGIDSAHEQVQIAAKKAGLLPHDRLELKRFEVLKLAETRDAS
jgi:AmmeMemoRadiSam system protein A